MSEAPKVVEAVAIASSASLLPANTGRRRLSVLIEKAMSQAVTDSYAAGIVDPVKVKENIMAAREKAIQDFYNPQPSKPAQNTAETAKPA